MAEMPIALTTPQLARHAKNMRAALVALMTEVHIAIVTDDNRRLGQTLRDVQEVMRDAPAELGLRNLIELSRRIDEEAARV